MSSGTEQPPKNSAISLARNSLTGETLRGFSWSGLSSVIQAVLQVVVISTLARLLSPHDFGLFGIALIFSTFAERIGKLGIGPSLVQMEVIGEEHARTGFSISILLGVMMFALLWIFSGYLSSFFSEPELIDLLKAVGFIFIIDSLGTVSESLLQRSMRFKELLVINNGAYILGNGLVAITMAYLGYGVWSLVGGSLFGRVFKVIILFWKIPHRPTLRLKADVTKSLLRLGVGYTIAKLFNYAALVGDNFVVGRLMGADALGLYSRAYQIMTLPATYVGQVMEKVLFPAIAKRQNAKDRLAKVYLLGIEGVGLFAFPTSVFVFCATEEIVRVVLGRQWMHAVPVLQILSFGVFFRTAYKNGDTLVSALGAVYKHSLRQFIYATLIIGGTIYGSRWGLDGVSWAVLFAVFMNYVLMSRLSHQLLNLQYQLFFRAHLPGLWLSFWMGLVLFPSAIWFRALDLNAFVSLPLLALVSLVVCIFAAVIAPGIFRASLAGWMLENVNLGKFGKPGKVVLRFLRLCEGA